MADLPWDQTIWNVRERPLSSDENQQASQLAATIRDAFNRAYNWRSASTGADAAVGVLQGFLEDGFKCNPGSGMQVVLSAGIGFQDGTGDAPTNINGCLNLDDLYPCKPLVLTLPETIGVPAADATNPRIDIVEVKYDRQINNPQSRGILNTVTGVFDATLVEKTMTFDLSGLSTVNSTGPINYKTGTPGATPTAPTTDAGYIKIAEVYVPANATSIQQYNCANRRRILAPNGVMVISGTFQYTLSGSTIDWVTIEAPPGVDVDLTVGYGDSGDFEIGPVVGGPATNLADGTGPGTAYGSIVMSVVALTSGLPLPTNPCMVQHTPLFSFNFFQARQGADPLVYWPPTSNFIAPSGTTHGASQNQWYGNCFVTQWDSSGKAWVKPGAANTGSPTVLQGSFMISIPIL